MLSDRVDLTEDRHFGPDINGSNWNVIAREFNMAQQARLELRVDPETQLEQLIPVRIFPWTCHIVDSDDFLQESPRFDDDLFNELGFEFHGSIDHPFLFGNRHNRRIQKLVLSEIITHDICEMCGKPLTIFDQHYPGLYFCCKKCSADYFRDKAMADAFLSSTSGGGLSGTHTRLFS